MLKRGFLLTILGAALCTPSAHADLAADLIAHYSFNGHMMDISGNANHGSGVGGVVSTTDRFGNPDGAYEFNGINSYVHIPNSVSLSSPDTAVTQAAWVLLYGASLVGQAFGPVTMKSTSTTNAFMYRMTASPGGIGTAFNNWNNGVGISHTLDLQRWYHVATVFDGMTVRFFLNGAPLDTLPANFTIAQDSRDLTIGGDVPGILEIFYGKIDEVRIYSRALSNAEIAEMYGEDIIGIQDPPLLSGLSLSPSYPNPTSGHARVDFTLPSRQSIALRVHDVTGRRVRDLESGTYPAGRHSALWDGRDDQGRSMPAGLYFVRLQTRDRALTTRIARIP